MDSRLSAVVDRLRSPRIFVLGDLILDRYIWGAVTRISPEAPVQVLDADHEEFRVGGAANVAHNLAALGGRVLCGGLVGTDSAGTVLLRLLRKLKVNPSAVVRDSTRPTPLKTRLLAHNQQMIRIDHERRHPVSGTHEKRLAAAIAAAARSCDLALVSDYHKGTLTAAISRTVVEEFTRRGKPVLVGLKGRDMAKYRKATGASLNRAELAHLSGLDDVAKGAKRILKSLALQFIVVTLGDKGMAVYRRDGEVVRLSAAARQVYDVTGAGDTVLAAFALGCASGLTLEECAILATAAAGIVVAKVGTATVTRGELLEGAAHRKILHAAAMNRSLDGERRRGRKIVFTNGCFDLVHAGHLRTLEFARSKGDVLVVGLNSDASVRRLKGAGRPILEGRDRAALLAAMECVDYVVMFDEDTPDRIIRTLKPDVLVKGQDYSGRNVVGRSVVEARGGRVELAPLVKGASTSGIIAKIRGTK